MAHPEQRQFVSLVKKFFVKDQDLSNYQILEVGSFDVNGNIRSIFEGCRSYIGVDLADGPGVDVIGSGNTLDFADNSFDLTISCECFEHDPFWIDTFNNMTRMTRTGGLVIVTCALLGRLEHGTRRSEPEQAPGTQSAGFDYYRNLCETDFRENLLLENQFSFFRFYTRSWPQDLYFFGIKREISQSIPPDNDIRNFEEAVREIRNSEKKSVTLRRLFHTLHTTVPLLLMSRLLPEPIFQDTAIRYLKFKNSLKKTPDTIKKD